MYNKVHTCTIVHSYIIMCNYGNMNIRKSNMQVVIVAYVKDTICLW